MRKPSSPHCARRWHSPGNWYPRPQRHNSIGRTA
jgi:hypothetical protein